MRSHDWFLWRSCGLYILDPKDIRSLYMPASNCCLPPSVKAVPSERRHK